jgi:hypothetical protein
VPGVSGRDLESTRVRPYRPGAKKHRDHTAIRALCTRWCQDSLRSAGECQTYGLASNTRLNGVSVVRRNQVNPPAITTLRNCSSVARVPRTVCPEAIALGVQQRTDAPENTRPTGFRLLWTARQPWARQSSQYPGNSVYGKSLFAEFLTPPSPSFARRDCPILEIMRRMVVRSGGIG